MDIYAGVFELDKDDHAARLSAAAEKASEDKCSQNVRASSENNQKPWGRLGDLNPVHQTPWAQLPTYDVNCDDSSLEAHKHLAPSRNRQILTKRG